MSGILFTCRSITHAQIIKRTLENNGISARIVRPDSELTRGNCAYAVNISQTYFAEAIETLRFNKTMPIRAILVEKYGYRELEI